VSLYDTLRHFADSHWLVAMMFIFMALCTWPFRPGSGAGNNAAANSIFKDAGDGE
jgi:cytochrome c oxidase cbb3-type subunit 4